MGIKENAFAERAGHLLMELKDRKRALGSGNIDGEIHRIMTHRDTDEGSKKIYEAHYKGKEKDYQARILALEFAPPAQTEPGSFFGFGCTNRSKEQDKVGQHKVTYKEYFTFYPDSKDPAGVYEEITKFIGSIPVLHKKLCELNAETKDAIQSKIPGSLRVFHWNMESLTIYYHNKKLGRRIRDIVIPLFKSRGVTLGRELRAESGFDLEKDGERKSHSELVSKIIAKDILMKRERICGLTDKEFAEWLKKSMIEVSKWTPEQACRFLGKHKGV